MKLTQVKEFNSRQKSQIMHFTIGTGAYMNEDRKNGWIVSGYSSNDSHKYFSNKQKAIAFINK